MMTTFADVRFNPNPPTDVVRSIILHSESSLNLLTMEYRFETGTFPSNLKYLMWANSVFKSSSQISWRDSLNLLKMRTLFLFVVKTFCSSDWMLSFSSNPRSVRSYFSAKNFPLALRPFINSFCDAWFFIFLHYQGWFTI